MSDSEDDWEKAAQETVAEEETLKKSKSSTPKPAAYTPARQAFSQTLAPTNDIEAERKRIALLQETADAQLGARLFDGQIPEDLQKREAELLAEQKQRGGARAGTVSSKETTLQDRLTGVKLGGVKDVEEFVAALKPAIMESQAKSNTWLRLLDMLLFETREKMEVQDMEVLVRKIQANVKDKKKEANLKAQKSKKSQNLEPNPRNYMDEVNMIYGSDRDSDDEEDEDFI